MRKLLDSRQTFEAGEKEYSFNMGRKKYCPGPWGTKTQKNQNKMVPSNRVHYMYPYTHWLSLITKSSPLISRSMAHKELLTLWDHRFNLLHQDRACRMKYTHACGRTRARDSRIAICADPLALRVLWIWCARIFHPLIQTTTHSLLLTQYYYLNEKTYWWSKNKALTKLAKTM